MENKVLLVPKEMLVLLVLKVMLVL